ncbi:sulfurtransferase-like selenium metabolism protein YedF [Chloroflexota bacterium]
MAKIVDARNLPCPQPVMLTMKALKEADEVTTIVDNETARGNVSRLANSQGCKVTIEQKGGGIYLTLTKKEVKPAEEEPPTQSGIVVFVASDILGRGENIELGNLLIHSFLNTLGGLSTKPESIIFMNNGVKLVVEDSLVVGELKQMESQGVEILACGTCLSRLNLTDRVAVGQVSNMYTLADTLLRAKKVIPL